MSRIERLNDGLAELKRNTRKLQERVMRIHMPPVSFAFKRFPRQLLVYFVVHIVNSSIV